MDFQDQEKLVDHYATEFGLLEKRTPPPELFHYTSSDTLLSIIQSKSFWTTHILDMNDSMEFRHGMEKFRDALNSQKLSAVDQGWLKKIKDFFDTEMKKPLAMPFVFSMTENHDQLSQWRGYGDQAKGVSIGLSTSEFLTINDLVLKVEYDETKQESIVNSVLDGFIALIRSIDQKILDDGNTWGLSCPGRGDRERARI